MDATIQPLRVPAVSVDVALPWFTGQPYAVYAHVRAITMKGPTGWSSPFAFNMRWASIPTPLPTQPGLVRWGSVSGATGYQVGTRTSRRSSRRTQMLPTCVSSTPSTSWYTTVKWRVRAVRRVFGTVPNGLPAVSYGAWSPVYTASNPTIVNSPIQATLAVSDQISDGKKQSAHELMPGLAFNGNQGLNGAPMTLYRAYAATDRDCVNIVYKGSIVGSPAFAPRTSGPLRFEDDVWAASQQVRGFPHAVPDGTPLAREWSNDWRPIVSNEVPLTASGATTTAPASDDESTKVIGTRVDLPDIDFPTTRYYWTIVPVTWKVNESDPLRSSAGGTRRRRRMPAPPAASRASARKASRS